MGKTIFITGAGTGLGRGAAIGLAKKGHRVIASTELTSQKTDLLREANNLDNVRCDAPKNLVSQNVSYSSRAFLYPYFNPLNMIQPRFFNWIILIQKVL